MSENTEALEAQSAQRAAAHMATMDTLRTKRRGEKQVGPLVLNEGEEPVTFLFRAVSAPDYDKLITASPPTKDQLVAGSGFDVNKLGPALLARVCADPQLSVAEWTELWNSPEWSGGEIGYLFNEAMTLCNRGLSLAPTAAG